MTEANTRKNLLVSFVIALWTRLPVVIQAILIGLIVAAVGTIPWAMLVSANAKHWSAIPWSVVPAALYLCFFWRFVRGEGWPRSSAEVRRKHCRANSLSGAAWGIALTAGVLGLATVVLFQRVMTRLVTLPQQQGPAIAQFPFMTQLLWVLMGSLVAGVVEETSFRGYLQKPIEERHGPVIAMLVTGSLFGFTHFTHPEVGLILLPYYLMVAAVYGTLAFLTNSIFPSLVLHTAGNMLGALALLTQGRSEWQASSNPTPLIWETGLDASFGIAAVAFLVVGTAAVSAYFALAKVNNS
jgi:membrane protease YdiL (CAAX protease family)